MSDSPFKCTDIWLGCTSFPHSVAQTLASFLSECLLHNLLTSFRYQSLIFVDPVTFFDKPVASFRDWSTPTIWFSLGEETVTQFHTNFCRKGGLSDNHIDSLHWGSTHNRIHLNPFWWNSQPSRRIHCSIWQWQQEHEEEEVTEAAPPHPPSHPPRASPGLNPARAAARQLASFSSWWLASQWLLLPHGCSGPERPICMLLGEGIQEG